MIPRLSLAPEPRAALQEPTARPTASGERVRGEDIAFSDGCTAHPLCSGPAVPQGESLRAQPDDEPPAHKTRRRIAATNARRGAKPS